MTDVVIPKHQKTENTKSTLRWAALFLGELRDGLTMVRPNAIRERAMDYHCLFLSAQRDSLKIPLTLLVFRLSCALGVFVIFGLADVEIGS